MGSGAYHHPDYSVPRWVILIKNHLWHKVVTMVQRMNSTEDNLMYLRGFIDALDVEYLRMRRDLDVAQGIGADSNAVKKAVKKAEENRG